MTFEEVKRTLSGIPPQHDVARAITALLNGMLIEDLATVSAPAAAIGDAQLRQTSGRIAALQDLKRTLSELWARTVEAQADPGAIPDS